MQHEKTLKAREALIRSMIHGEGSEQKLEELLDILVDEKFALKYLSGKDEISFSEKMSDHIAAFAGSWAFIIVFSILMAAWIIINELFLKVPFDPYPFILLNLILSLISSVQSPIIMMSQNRQAKSDRQRSEHQYNINLKCEVLLEDIHIKLEEILRKLDEDA
ncbi:MAG: DUF1003 domain-containing protein [Eubacteriaceae bacterium]|nr:DUF1003 domain-containing protein [Eubacteriaceae bacterium]